MPANENKSGCLGILLAPFLGRKAVDGSAQEELPYARRDDFLSHAEISFFHIVRNTLSAEHHLITKVNLADLFFVRQPHINLSARGKISQKHVDFVICDTATMNPLVAIELDDASHQKPDRQARDTFVDQVFVTAGLPLIRIPAARAYNPEQIRLQLAPHLSMDTQAESPPPSPLETTDSTPINVEAYAEGNQADAETTPVCERCGSPMVERMAKRGPNSGQTFWGCSAYPKCRHTLTR